MARSLRPHRHSKLTDDSHTFQSLLPNCCRALHRIERDSCKSPTNSSSLAHSKRTVDRPFSLTQSYARRKRSRAPLVLPQDTSVRPDANHIFHVKLGGHSYSCAPRKDTMRITAIRSKQFTAVYLTITAFAYDLRAGRRAILRSNCLGLSSTATTAALSCI